MSKRRVKLPGRFADENKWYVIRFSSDNELSAPLRSGELEDPETGETGEEKVFKVGDKVNAPWTDGIIYHGVIERESESKEDCLKYKESKKKTKNKKRKVDKPVDSEVSAEDSALKKKKKEKNEEKKKIESARKQTEMATAEELFKSSFLTASHDIHVSSNNIEMSSSVTSSATACSTTLSSSHLNPLEYEPISPVKSSSPQIQSSQACSVNSNPSTSPQTQSSQACSVNSNPSSSPQTQSSQACSVNSNQSSSQTQSSQACSVNSNPSSSPQTQSSQACSVNSNQSSSQTQSSLACSVDSFPHFNRGLGFPTPFHPLSSLFYPFYQTNQNPSSVVPNSSMMNVPSPPKLNSSTSSECPPSHSDSPTHLLNLTSSTQCTVDNSDYHSSSNNDLNAGDVSTFTSASSQSNSIFLSALSDNGCGDCVLKDTELNRCKEYQSQQERDISYWKSEAIKLRAELDTLRENNSEKATQSTSQDNHYLPKRGICVEKCCYVVAENPENFEVPRGYVKFAEGHDIYIEAKWMANIKSLFRGKTKPHCLKLIMNGFYEPKELQKKTAMMLLQTPLGQALKAFAITTFGMDNTDIVKAINTKIGTMCRAMKENRLSK